MQQQRINKLKKILEEKNLDGFLVSNFYNILYLTGFKTLTENEREAWVLATKDETYLFSDGRYFSNIKYKISNIKNIYEKSNIIKKLITPQNGLIYYLQKIVSEKKIKRIGFEGDDLKVNELQKLKEKLIGVEPVSTEKIIIKMREIKEDEEIRKIKKACQITDRCLREIIKTIKIGMTEKEIAFKIEFWLKEKGYDLAFYPIVAIDKNSAIPHYDTRSQGNEKVKDNSIVLIDFGAKFQDYHSDITRMIFVGEPTNEMVNVYNQLLTTQIKTVEQCSNEKMGKNLDSFCRQLLTFSFELSTYPHSTGHGIGLETHEYPKISQTSSDIIKSNQVFTIEPGVYFEGKWGMRIEDTIYIDSNHRANTLTKFTKEMVVRSN